MVQRKKEDVRDAILNAAFDLFSERGYSETSIPRIARRAGISTANVYVYFDSKIEILFTLYSAWLERRLDRMGRSLARVKDPQARLTKLLLTLWRDLPRESNGFANNVIQAVSTSNRNGGYSPRLREDFQVRVAEWILDCLDVTPRESAMIAGVALMAFDGFAINVHLVHGVACDTSIASLFGRLLGSASGKANSRRRSRGDRSALRDG
jgi:AcrR family transcriptional regulator